MQEPVDQDSNKQISEYWNIPSDSLLQELGTSMSGLPAHIAGDFLDWYGPNVIRKKDNLPVWQSFIQQFKNPIILLLLFAAVLSAFLGDPVDAITITVIVLLSSFLDLIQEYRANAALQKLLTIIQPTATVIRDGESIEIPAKDLVPGDVVSFSVGKIIPADCVVLDAKNLFVNEMTLTGEAFPVEKKPGVSPASAGIANRINVLFMSTDVTSGTGTGLVVKTGIATEFGKISERLRLRSPETAFEKMTRNYGYFLMKITAFLVIGVFILNTLVNPGSKSIFDSFVFALALAVGMTPQLLPAIITITLANGAKTMAKKKVIVKRLNSIENFGSMNVLCSDKTGTLTEGTTKLLSAVDYQGNPSEKVMLYSYLNAFFESGFVNPIDKAILAENTLDACDFTKLDEMPYDFKRKRLSVVVSNDEANVLICKGALASILDVCSLVETSEGTRVPLEDLRDQIQAQYDNLSNEGYRVIAVGYRDDFVPGAVENGEEANLTFIGFVVFSDPLRDGIADVINNLNTLGIRLKLITGDSKVVALHVASQIHLENARVLRGPDIQQMSDEDLLNAVNSIDIFAETEPSQKERILLALKKRGNVVGFIGDGVNDAPAIHAADVGISVNNAVDVAKEAADIILLDKQLSVVLDGIQEGRKTYANTYKYIFITTSQNFGNVFTMAGASAFLPILPMLPEQLLLTNLLTDIPYMTVATDNVDPEQVLKPYKWDMRFIRNFMIVFGVLSSAFDLLTFIVLYATIGFDQRLFSTGWFIFSNLHEFFVVFIIRTRRSFFESRPSNLLTLTSLGMAIASIAMLYIPFFKDVFQFSPPPVGLLGVICAIVSIYVVANEITKKLFFRKSEAARLKSNGLVLKIPPVPGIDEFI